MRRRTRLDEIAERYSTLTGMDRYTNEYQYRVMKPHFKGRRVLELGCADGATTRLLVRDFDQLTVVDGSHDALARLVKTVKSTKLTVIEGMFETVAIEGQFDTVIMGHIMEHVEDPVGVMRRFVPALSKRGVMLISVPNALSYHRLAGVSMGLLKDPYTLNATDTRIGHRRVYDRVILAKDIERAGLDVVQMCGYWLKFLSNTQLEQLPPSVIDTYFRLGIDYPEHAAEIVAVCRRRV